MLFRRHFIFSCAMLSGVSWATLFFVCSILSQEYYDIIEQDFFMWNDFWKLLDNITQGNIEQDLFQGNIFWGPLDSIAQGFYLCNVVPRVWRQHWTRFFLCNVACSWYCLEAIGQHCTKFLQSFYLCNVVPRVLRQHWTGIFPVQCCLEPIGQHCTKFLPEQCFPKSIKTTLNRIFSCGKLSKVSRTTLHRVLHVR